MRGETKGPATIADALNPDLYPDSNPEVSKDNPDSNPEVPKQEDYESDQR